MRSFSNILPKFATNLHLLVDSIDFLKPEFGIRNTFKKLVISIIFSIFVVENQYIINKEYYHYGDYQRQNYRNFLYYR